MTFLICRCKFSFSKLEVSNILFKLGVMVVPSPAIFLNKVMPPLANGSFEHALTGQQFNSIKQLFHCKTFPPKLFPSNIHPKCLYLGP